MSELPKKKLTRAQLMRFKKKQRKERGRAREEAAAAKMAALAAQELTADESEVEIEYIVSDPFANNDTDDYVAIKEVFDKFGAATSKPEVEKEEQVKKVEEVKKVKLSARQKKLAKRVNIAVLKQLVARPDLVEMPDTCAAQPFVHLHLKGYHNVVNVPRHWSDRPKYLQGKRGVEKKPFELPDFIKNTGISEIRGAMLDKDAGAKLKQKTRERVSGATGKMEIDYKTLHDAFFRFQTKPQLTKFGELYYEGKEYEVVMTSKRPGVLSDELKEALGMQEGHPPPWLINMQNIGPPPAYPNLLIPGLNAPAPPTAEFGYHIGGWGRPPVDPRTGQPLYSTGEAKPEFVGEQNFFGAIQVEEPSESSEEEDESEDEEAAPQAAAAPPVPGGTETPLGGLETPQNLEGTLRKKKVEENRSLYEVLQQTDASVGDAVLGSSHTYVLKKNKKADGEYVDLMKSRSTKSIDITLDPSQLDMTEEQLKKHITSEMEKEEGQPNSLKRKRPAGENLDTRKKKKKKKDSFKF
eukprot:TRINITY_DN5368_c0_g1_i1.p1 TRINITY_DN5368_c0_g1~~TRINITY_DN5368_c0_g1_i1.p1  ORF type:complete len:523 (+),score=196.24 TRINITY_DN5368_c0_g1_i1:79-1647(+)